MCDWSKRCGDLCTLDLVWNWFLEVEVPIHGRCNSEGRCSSRDDLTKWGCKRFKTNSKCEL